MKTTQEMSAVNVAKDVIAQIQAQRLIATRGNYCSTYVEGYYLRDWLHSQRFGEDEVYKEIKNRSFQELYQENESVKCEVCAIGAVFISFVNLYNDFSTEKMQAISSYTMVDRVNQVFSSLQMRTMERIFEGEWVEETEGFYEQDWANELFNKHNTYEENGEDFVEELLSDMGFDEDGDPLEAEEVILSLMQNIIDNNGDLMIPGGGLVK